MNKKLNKKTGSTASGIRFPNDLLAKIKKIGNVKKWSFNKTVIVLLEEATK